MTDVSPALKRGAQGELWIQGSVHHAGCVPHDDVPRVTRRLSVSLARDKQPPREMDVLGTLIKLC